jgi:CDP-glycerol glycerophosphotransferase (TagB/SpsB family)
MIKGKPMPEHYLLFLNVAYSFSILRPMQSAIRRRGATAAWFLHDLDSSHLKSDELLLHSIDEVKRFNPRAVFVPGNWVPDFFPGVKVQIFHGFGIEKKGHFVIRGFFDLYCTHGPLTTGPFEAYAEKYGYFKTIETGWPKMDSLLQFDPETLKETRERIGKPIVLYAPTFSSSLCSAPDLYEAIQNLSRQGSYHWLVKFHPLMHPDTVQQYREMAHQHLEFIEEPDIIPCLHLSDVLLTDTSSVVSEFLLLNKPVVTFRTLMPAKHVIDFQAAGELEDTLNLALKQPEAVMSSARNFVQQMHPYTDGRSSERVLAATDSFVDQFQDKLKPKPLNLYRKLRVRRRMNYYHWK